MKAPAYMKWYPRDIRSDVNYLALEDPAKLLYRHLLEVQWECGGTVPLDLDKVRRMALVGEEAWAHHKEVLCSPFFERVKGGFENKRCREAFDETRAFFDDQKTKSTFRWGEIAGTGDFSGDDGLDSKTRGKRLRSQRLATARKKGTHTEEQWRQMFDIFEGICACCQAPNAIKDHVIPIYQGGSDGLDNLQPLCRSCNASKGPDRTDFREIRRDAVNDLLEREGYPRCVPKGIPRGLPEGEPVSESQSLREKSSISVPSEPHPKLSLGDVPSTPKIKPSQIEKLYAAYPRKVGKKAALKSIQKALTEVPFDDLLEAVQAFAASPKGKSGATCPYPSTWFNQGRWEDDRSSWAQEGHCGAAGGAFSANGTHGSQKEQMAVERMRETNVRARELSARMAKRREERRLNG